MHTYLLIGGSSDGVRLDLPDGDHDRNGRPPRVIHVPVPARRTITFLLGSPSIEDRAFVKETYHRVELTSKVWQRWPATVYVHNGGSVSTEEVLARLIQGYKTP